LGFERQVQDIFKKHQPQSMNEFHVQALTDIHLRSHLKWELSENGDVTYVNILMIIAVFVIVIAGINYVNLSTAQSAKRAKEVGVRKVNGAFRRMLVAQFLFESFVMVMVSFGISIIVTSLLLPVLQPMTGIDLTAFTGESKWIITLLPACTVVIALSAGFYPAFHLSHFQPLSVLRGNFFATVSGIRLRQALVVFQFILSTVLITGAWVIREQVQFMSAKKLGFDQENVLMLPNVRGGEGNPEAMVEDFRKIGAVVNVARADGVLGFRNETNGVSDKQQTNHITLNFFRADYDFIPTLKIELAEGRNFSPQFPSDTGAIIINQKAVAQLGLKQPVIGQRLTWDDDAGKIHDVTIIGIANDFHFTSFHEEIKPFGFILEVNNGSTFFLKVQSSDLTATLEEIKRVWTLHNPEKPFDYAFQHEQIARLHMSEQKFLKLFSVFTGLAILIACLGLFGLVTALAESKTKEIGIRKVLGASVTGIVGLLAKEFVWLLLTALAIAIPVAIFGTDCWLNGFAYRIHPGWELFTLAGCCTLFIAGLTISFKSIGAAVKNPVDSLRTE
jgi:putative ABC transport system permease protein